MSGIFDCLGASSSTGGAKNDTHRIFPTGALIGAKKVVVLRGNFYKDYFFKKIDPLTHYGQNQQKVTRSNFVHRRAAELTPT